MKSQQQKLLELLLLGHEVDLTMTPFTTKCSSRLGEIERMYNLNIERGWKKLNEFVHPVTPAKRKSYMKKSNKRKYQQKQKQ
jgi:ribosomal protein L14E/L6E/L27E